MGHGPRQPETLLSRCSTSINIGCIIITVKSLASWPCMLKKAKAADFVKTKLGLLVSHTHCHARLPWLLLRSATHEAYAPYAAALPFNGRFRAGAPRPSVRPNFACIDEKALITQ